MADKRLSDVVGQPVVVPVITPTTAVTVSGSWTSNAAYAATETRVGSWAEYEVKVTTSGAPNGVPLTINLPAGRTIDTAKFVDSSAGNYILGLAEARKVGSQVYNGITGIQSGTTVVPYINTNSGSGTPNYGNTISPTSPFTFANTDYVLVRFRVPILEWAGQDVVAYGAGQATASKLGIVMGGTVPGNAGSTIAPGYIGQVIPLTSTNVVCSAAGSWYVNTTPMAQLTTGNWLVFGLMSAGVGGGSTQIQMQISTGTTAGAGGILPINGSMSSAASSFSLNLPLAPAPVQVTAATQNLYAQAITTGAGGNGTILGYAVRIG